MIETRTGERLLIVGPSWVGDMVMAQSLFKLLRRIQPDVEITVLAPDWSLPLLERMPEVNHCIKSPFGHGELKIAERFRFGRSLRGCFDRAIVLPNSFKSALIPRFAGIPHRVGWRGEFRNLLLSDCRRLDQEALPLMVQRFVALGLPESTVPPDDMPLPRLNIDRESAQRTRDGFGLGGSGQFLVLCPGAEFGEAKRWPSGHYASLGRRLILQGWQVWIVGSARDASVAEEIRAALTGQEQEHCFNLAGRTSLAEVTDIIAGATAVVSNDSGLMHIAAAVGSPLVALYGSTSPDFTPPLADRVKSLFTEIDCRPCFQRQCPLGHLRCLTELDADRVYQALKELLEQ